MNDKVKAKIEAMFPVDSVNENSHPDTLQSICYHNGKQYARREAATPWAEWCERFETALEKLKTTYDIDMVKDLLFEYREWLEE